MISDERLENSAAFLVLPSTFLAGGKATENRKQQIANQLNPKQLLPLPPHYYDQQKKHKGKSDANTLYR
jgi:hypothetical protein